MDRSINALEYIIFPNLKCFSLLKFPVDPKTLADQILNGIRKVFGTVTVVIDLPEEHAMTGPFDAMFFHKYHGTTSFLLS